MPTITKLRFAVSLMVAAGVGCGHRSTISSGTGGNGSGGAGTGGASGGTTGTGGAKPPDLQAMLTAAEATWGAAKSGCSIYAYEKYQHSVFGSCSRTAIEIENGQPLRRSFVSCASVPDGGVADQWDEIGATQIGTHDEGAAPETAEQLFADCQTVLTNVAADPSGYRASLRLTAEGIPLSCQATLIQCVDDCTDGISLDWFICEPSTSGDAGFNPG